MGSKEKFRESFEALKHSLKYEKKISEDAFYFGGIAKAFETSIEYAWKYFRLEALEAGLEVHSPRDAIKQAANLDLIDELDEWLGLLKTRNIAVHDYIGISQDEYLGQIKKFVVLGERIVK